MIYKIGLWMLLCVIVPNTFAQSDTLYLSIEEASALLFKNNLDIMAERYQIKLAEAEELQAGHWPNPSFVWNSDLYSVEKNEYGNFRNQKLIQIEMMVPLTGRRIQAKKLAEVGVMMRKEKFLEFCREMQYTFQALCIESKTKAQMIQSLQSALLVFDKTLESAIKRNEVGLIPNSEVLRLASERKSLRSQFTLINIEYLTIQSQIKTLLSLKNKVTVLFQFPTQIKEKPHLDSLLNTALSKRADLRLAQLEIAYADRQKKLEQANILGDAKIGFQPHDRGSNYVRPYTGLVFEIPVPVFDRNKGAIEMAEWNKNIAILNVQQKELEIQNQVASVYEKIILTQDLMEDFDDGFREEMKKLLENAATNYSTKLIDILEYLDIQRMYLQMNESYIEMQANVWLLESEIAYTLGTSITQ